MNSAWIVIQNMLQNDAQGHITNMIKMTWFLVLHLKQMNKTFFSTFSIGLHFLQVRAVLKSWLVTHFDGLELEF